MLCDFCGEEIEGIPFQKDGMNFCSLECSDAMETGESIPLGEDVLLKGRTLRLQFAPRFTELRRLLGQFVMLALELLFRLGRQLLALARTFVYPALRLDSVRIELTSLGSQSGGVLSQLLLALGHGSQHVVQTPRLDLQLILELTNVILVPNGAGVGRFNDLHGDSGPRAVWSRSGDGRI